MTDYNIHRFVDELIDIGNKYKILMPLEYLDLNLLQEDTETLIDDAAERIRELDDDPDAINNHIVMFKSDLMEMWFPCATADQLKRDVTRKLYEDVGKSLRKHFPIFTMEF